MRVLGAWLLASLVVLVSLPLDAHADRRRMVFHTVADGDTISTEAITVSEVDGQQMIRSRVTGTSPMGSVKATAQRLVELDTWHLVSFNVTNEVEGPQGSQRVVLTVTPKDDRLALDIDANGTTMGREIIADPTDMIASSLSQDLVVLLHRLDLDGWFDDPAPRAVPVASIQQGSVSEIELAGEVIEVTGMMDGEPHPSRMLRTETSSGEIRILLDREGPGLLGAVMMGSGIVTAVEGYTVPEEARPEEEEEPEKPRRRRR